MRVLTREILQWLKMRRGELTIVFLNGRALRELNRHYRHRDFPTDVLSFSLTDAKPGSDNFLGEVYISLDAARENARAFRSRFERELVLYIVHGVLHLAGYDDTRPGDRARMRKKEEEILARLCKGRDLSIVSMRP